jgi:hypothetical protein
MMPVYVTRPPHTTLTEGMAVTSFETAAPAVAPLRTAQALPLLRRAAGARGLTWPADSRQVTGVGGFTGNFTQLPGDEQVVWATLPGQNGLVALFSGDRLLAAETKSLGTVEAVQPLSLPLLPHLALMVDDRYDEMVGAYLVEQKRRIYVWDGRTLREIYRGVLSSEQYRHEKWDNPRGRDLWRLTRVTGQILPKGMSLTESTKVEEWEAPGSPREPLPRPAAFHLVSERTEEHKFRWDPRLRRYDRA